MLALCCEQIAGNGFIFLKEIMLFIAFQNDKNLNYRCNFYSYQQLEQIRNVKHKNVHQLH